MARRTVTIDEKIEKAKEKVNRAKDRYESALEELEGLMEEKKKLQSAELLKAIEKSDKSYEDIMKFLEKR